MDKNNRYIFESEFVDTNNIFLKVNCEDTVNDVGFCILINTYDDPYLLYYSNMIPENEEYFRTSIFEYLQSKYPDYF